jgi:hypothetical protein
MYTSLDKHKLLLAVIESHNPYEVCCKAGLEFAVGISPIEHKQQWLDDAQSTRGFLAKDPNNELVQFLADAAHMREYHDLIRWFDKLTYYDRRAQGPLPWAVCKDLLFGGGDLLDNAWYFCNTFEVDGNGGKADLAVSAAAFTHATYIHSRRAGKLKINSCQEMDMNLIEERYAYSKRNKNLWGFDTSNWHERTDCVFYLILEYVDYIFDSYSYVILDSSRKNASGYDLVLKFKNTSNKEDLHSTVMDHMKRWARNSKTAQEASHVRRFFQLISADINPARFAVALLKVLLMRRKMSRDLLFRPNAIALDKIGAEKNSRLHPESLTKKPRIKL